MARKVRRGEILVYGINPVREALSAAGVEILGIALLAGKGGKRLEAIRQRAVRLGLPVVSVGREELNGLTGTVEHQGAAARLARFPYVDLEDIVHAPGGDRGAPLLVALDGVTDPGNLGAVARSALFLGAAGLILPRDRSAAVTGAAVKSSAGALLHLPISRVTNLPRALNYLKEQGYWIAGASSRGGVPLWDVDLKGPLVIVLGSEEKGMRPLVRGSCDLIISIPAGGRLSSLNVSAAAAVVLYEAIRRRG